MAVAFAFAVVLVFPEQVQLWQPLPGLLHRICHGAALSQTDKIKLAAIININLQNRVSFFKIRCKQNGV